MATKPTGKPDGQPTKYKPEYCDAIVAYFLESVGYPTLEGFCIPYKFSSASLHTWAKEHPEFFKSKEKAIEIQKHRTIEGAMNGSLNTAYSIFIGKNCHGMKDKVEQEISGLDAININIVKPRQKRGE
jgi:hypothetical protein